MKRARRDNDLMPPGKAAKGQRKPASPEIGNQNKILEDKINYLMAENHERFLLLEAVCMVLQVNAELGGFEYDLDLIRSARAKVLEFCAKADADELTGMENDEVIAARYAEFKAENFEE